MILPQQWYVILESKQVQRQPFGIKRLGKDFVLWREANGSLVCLVNSCPHRGASLSLGRVLDGCIECSYHGFQYNSQGQCVKIPCQPESTPIPLSLKAKAMPLREAYGFIWLWWGDIPLTFPPIPWFDEELPVNCSIMATEAKEYPLQYERIVESNFDVHHFPIVHRSLNWGIAGSILDPYDVEVQGDCIRTSGRLRHEQETDSLSGFSFEVIMRFPNLTFARLYPKLCFITAATPIDEKHSWVMIRYYQNYILDPLLGYLFARILVWFEFNVVQERQDLPVLKSLPAHTTGTQSYQLVAADKAIAYYWQMHEKLSNKASSRLDVSCEK